MSNLMEGIITCIITYIAAWNIKSNKHLKQRTEY